MIADAVAIQRPRQASCRPFIEMSTRRVRNATIANSRSTPAQLLKRSPKPPRRLPSAQPLHIHRSPYLPVQFHAFHPSALCPSWQKTFCCWTFAPARPLYPAASLRDFLSGALMLGRYPEITLELGRFLRDWGLAHTSSISMVGELAAVARESGCDFSHGSGFERHRA